MADPVWPSSLPNPLHNNYHVRDDPPLRRIQMESGPDRVIRISTSFTSKLRFDLYLTKAQVGTLRDFYDATINAGSYWFSMPLITKGEVVNHRSRIIGGLNWRFVTNERWFVSFDLEIEDRL